MSFAVMRMEKLKKEKLGQASAHHKNRDNLKHREHPELERLNKNWMRNDKTLSQNVREQKKITEKLTGRKIRKDAVVCVEVVLTASPNAFKTINIKDWIKKNFEWIKKEFKTSKIIQYNIEFDEETPHIHVFLIPIDDKEKFNAKKIMGDKDELIRKQDSYAEYMKEFNLKRGISKEITHAKHKPLKRYRRELMLEIKQQEEQIKRNDEIIRRQLKENVFSDDIKTENIKQLSENEIENIFEEL